LAQGKGCRKSRSRSLRQTRLTLVREEHCEPEAVSQWHLPQTHIALASGWLHAATSFANREMI
jgi:hypothetical protein